MRWLPIILLLLVSAAASAHEPASIVYYPIHATTDREVIDAMRSQGPADPTGKRYPGHTEWSVAWNYRWQSQGSRCKVEAPTVQLKGTITLPRWEDRDRADPVLQERWDAFMPALIVHEQGHYQNGVDAAEALRTQLALLKTNKGCASLATEVDAVGRAIVEEYQQRDRQYDLDTGHGRTQDAFF